MTQTNSGATDEAIQNLKAKLQALGAALKAPSNTAAVQAASTEHLTLSLMGATDPNKVALSAKYVFKKINPDWNPLDHPRDPKTGKFIKTLGGFIFGKTKSAEFKGYSNLDTTIKLDLQPGDVAFQTPAKNVIVSHADGSYEIHVYGSKVGPQKIPAGSNSTIADNVQSGKYQKVAENPGTHVPAKDLAEAEAKIENPSKAAGVKAPEPKTDPKNVGADTTAKALESAWDVPKPTLKPGKTHFTGKQYADYQKATKGLELAKDADGNSIKSGDWIDLDGKPYLIHASPYEGQKVTAYRWVSTKQQAANLAKENLIEFSDLAKAKRIDDPTGKPYGVETGPKEVKPEDLKHGNIMSKAVVGAIPNTAVAHKKHIADNEGKNLYPLEESGQWIKSGDWVEIEGKPFQVFASPNEGNIAMAKWVGTKKQASNNTYDFPTSVLGSATKISDPTGKDYTPLPQETDAPETSDAPDDPETVESIKDGLKKGQLAYSDVASIAQHGSPESQAAAKQVFLDVYEDFEGEPTQNFLNQMEKAGVPIPEAPAADDEPSTDPWELTGPDDLENVPVGAILHISHNNVEYFYRRESDDQWKRMAEVDWPALSHEIMTNFVSSNGGEFAQASVYPEGSQAHADVIGDHSLYPIQAQVYVQGSLWNQQNDTWVKAGLNLKATDEQIEAIEAAQTKVQTLLDQVNGFDDGDSVGSYSYSGDNFTTYTQINGGTEFQNNGTGSTISKDEFLSIIGDAATHSKFKLTVLKKGSIKDQVANAEDKDSIYWESTTDGSETAFYFNAEENAWESNDGMTIDTAMMVESIDSSVDVNFTYVSAATATSPDIQTKSASEDVFVHPVSGLTFPMKPGYKVYKHKSTEHGYIIVTDDPATPINFFTSNGKLQKPKATQKSLDKNYSVTEDWPGSKDGQQQVSSVSIADQIKHAKPGTTVKFTSTNTDETNVWTKNADGTWTAPNSTKHDESAVISVSKMTSVETELSDSAPEAEIQSSVSKKVGAAIPGDKVTVGGADPTVYTKQSSGNWAYVSDTSGADLEVDSPSLTSMVSVLENHHPNIPVNFIPFTQVLHDADNTSTDTPDAPWGGKESLGDNPPPKPKKAKSKGKAKLPTTFTLPNGQEGELEFGETYGRVNYGGGEYYVIARAQKKSSYLGTSTVYDAAGTEVSVGPLKKLTPTALRKWIKDNGGELLAERKFSKAATSLDSYESITADNATVSINGVDVDVPVPGHGMTDPDLHPDLYLEQWLDKVRNQVTNKHIMPLPSWGATYIPSYQNIPGFDETWNNLSLEAKAEVFTRYEGLAGRMAKTIEDAKAGLEKNQKTKFSKAQKMLTLVERAAVLARELTNPDTDWDDEKFAEEVQYLVTAAGASPGTFAGPAKNFYPTGDVAQVLQKLDNQRKFKNSLSGLDFDPYDATTPEYDAWAKTEHNFIYLSALPEAAQKNWVLWKLGDPNLADSGSAIESQVEKAKTKVEIAALASQLGGPDTIPDTVKGVWAKSQMKSSYTWEDDNGSMFTLTHVGADEWQWDTGASNVSVTDAAAFNMVNAAIANGADVEESGALAYGPVEPASALEKIQNKHPGWNATQIAVAEGYSGPSHLAEDWLFWHVIGDEIAKYQIESLTPGTTDTHPGSPDNPLGKASYTALAVHIAQHPSGLDYLNTGGVGSAAARVQLLKHVGAWEEGPLLSTQWSRWRDAHPHKVLKPFLYTQSSADSPVAEKPVHVPQEAWAVVDGSTPDTDLTSLTGPGVHNLTEAELDASIAGDNHLMKAGITPLNSAPLPVHLKRLAVWAASDKDDPLRFGIIESIAAKAKSGEFLDDHTPVWIAPDGAKYPISPGAKVFQDPNDGEFLISGPPSSDGSFNTGYLISGSGGSPNTVPAYHITQAIQGNNTYKEIFTMPAPVTWAQAQKDNPDFTLIHWTLSEKIEKGTASKYVSSVTGAILTAELKKSTALQDNWPNLYAQHKSLPENIRQAVLTALNNSDKPVLDILEYKASKGHYASMQADGLFNASKPWVPHLSKGQTSPEAVINSWSAEAKDGYLAHFGLTSHGQIAEHLDRLLNPRIEAPSVALPAWEDLKLTKTGKSLGGMHTKYHMVDQDGNEWMVKTFQSDPSMAEYRIDAEASAMRISNLFGFRAPAANGQHVPALGSYGYVQHLKPKDKDFVGVNPQDLTPKQLQQAMEEHLLDWMISNHDTHHQNLLLDPSGNVFGIDKGQAFKFFPNDKLAVGYLPPGNPEPVWYDRFYKSVQTGSLTKEQIDGVVKHVLRRAQKISKDKDDEYREELKQALAKRPEHTYPSEFPTQEKFIDALVERKHNLFDTFVDFYKGLYASSPYEWDIDTENLIPPALDPHTHIAPSTDFSKDVAKAGIHGKALFFTSEDLEDSHVLFSKVIDETGKPVLTGEAKIRAGGDKKLTDWLKKQTIESKVNSYQGQSYIPSPSEPDYATLPNNAEFFSAMVNYSKTVSSHNASGDKQYNQGTVSMATAHYNQIIDLLDDVEQWESTNPGVPFSGSSKNQIVGGHSVQAYDVDLKTMEQHNAYKEMLNKYKGYFEKVKAHEGTDNKVSPHFTQHVYTPSDAAKAEFKAKLLSENISEKIKAVNSEGTTQVWGKKDANTWLLLETDNPSDVTGSALSNSAIDAMKNHNGYTITELDSDGGPEVEVTEATVQVGTKVLKVTHRQAATQSAALNAKGELVMKSGEIPPGHSAHFDSGNMYEIDFGSTVIQYRPWDDNEGVALSQKGLLRFKKTDWDENDYTSIDEILDVLRHMGLDLDPADEDGLQLFYWKHLTNVIRERAEGKQGHASEKKVIDHVDANLKSGMTSAEELQVFRTAWATLIGDDGVDSADWMPKFSRTKLVEGDDEFTSGHPYWMRPGYTVAELRAKMKNRTIASSLYKPSDALKIAKSGSMLSSEERYRVLVEDFKSGWSSEADKGYGSSAFIFTRQNMAYSWHGGYDASVAYHPKVLLRTHNYAFPGDTYGKLHEKKNSPFNLNKTMTYDGGSNELLIKNSMSLLDDIAVLKFPNEKARQEAIKYYKDRGITTIHGLPIEEVFLINGDGAGTKKVLDYLWDQWEKEEKEAAA